MSRALLRDYRKQLQKLDVTRKRMEELHVKRHIVIRDIHVVYESLFLRAVTGFEQFCDTLFHDILHRKTRYRVSRVSCKISAISQKAMQEVVLRNGRYLDWLPYIKAEETAKIYLKEGKPFTLVDD